MLGGIKIVRESSRHSIERKLKELEEEKDKGNISLEDYDTLRIRYERKLGNKETVSKLQEAKGFKPSVIKEKKAKRQELYDDFVEHNIKISVNRRLRHLAGFVNSTPELKTLIKEYKEKRKENSKI